MTDEILARPEGSGRRTGWLAAGGMIGAVLASSCCLAPLVLLLLGISGAWIGNLTALEPFKPYFAAAALVFIGLGFWRVYFHPRPACAGNADCGSPRSAALVKAALWAATALVLVALTIDWWAPHFY